MMFSTPLLAGLAAIHLAFASPVTNEKAALLDDPQTTALTVANFWAKPNKVGSLGYINDQNLGRCVTAAGQVPFGSVEVSHYPHHAFYCNLYKTSDCAEPWVAQVTYQRLDLPAEHIHAVAAKCFAVLKS
ncbi:hypothetical protein FQN57_006148 [Myotisia sp. PD_48]|nr:hypothetical protein FQN57_006148 [Myotisia sp. PD_48]